MQWLRFGLNSKYWKLLSERDTIKIIKQILAGYKELLKKGVVHRDLKPANILFDNGTAKLTDFGFSKEVLI